MTILPSPAATSVATALGEISGDQGASLRLEAQHGLQNDVAVAGGTPEHRVSGIAQDDDPARLGIGEPDCVIDKDRVALLERIAQRPGKLG